MEDSFKVRAEKVFGSLGNTASSLSMKNPSLWSLTDDEIKRQEWNRNKEEEEEDDDDDDESGPSDCLPKKREIDVEAHEESDLQELSDLEEEDKVDGETENRSSNDVDDGDWDVRSLIGRDCTLDYEDEEDEYDKVAMCREETGDRLYMRDVKVAEYGFEKHHTYGELPNTFQEVVKDPRANHMAAKLRLKEDAEAAGDTDPLQYTDNSVSLDLDPVETEDNRVELDGYNPKPILKKRGSNVDSNSKSGKRVRFELNADHSTQKHEEQLEPCSRDDVGAPQEASNLPDYLRNPSKYTRYTFDSSEDMDEQSNQKAYMDFFHQLKKGNSEDDTCADITKPIVFTPRKKTDDDLMVKRRNEPVGDNATKKGLPIGVAEEEEQEIEVTAMEEDEPDMGNEGSSSNSLQKPGRQYRSRTSAYGDDESTT